MAPLPRSRSEPRRSGRAPPRDRSRACRCSVPRPPGRGSGRGGSERGARRGMVERTRNAGVEAALDRMGIHHVDLVVSSIERSLPFYRELLGPLGWHGIGEVEGERGETIWYLNGRDTSIGLRESQSEPQDVDRYSIGLHHLAIEAASRAIVDERARWLRANGALLESEPQEYTYMPGYYAVFFYDPDGLKLEILHVPALAA